MTRWIRLIAVVGALVLVAAACGSSGGSKSSDSKSSTTTTTKAKAKPSATATPTTGLTNGAAVTVTAKGFTAGKTIGINECAQAGTAEVGAADCDLSNLPTITIGSDGTGTGVIKVSSGPLGQAQHMCTTAGTRCFLSVGELAEGDVERADDVDLTFAG